MTTAIKGSVVFQGHDSDIGAWGQGGDSLDAGLTPGTLYDVTDIEVHSWHTLVILHGVIGKFNTAYFKWVDETPLFNAIAEWRKENSI